MRTVARMLGVYRLHEILKGIRHCKLPSPRKQRRLPSPFIGAKADCYWQNSSKIHRVPRTTELPSSSFLFLSLVPFFPLFHRRSVIVTCKTALYYLISEQALERDREKRHFFFIYSSIGVFFSLFSLSLSQSLTVHVFSFRHASLIVDKSSTHARTKRAARDDDNNKCAF